MKKDHRKMYNPYLSLLNPRSTFDQHNVVINCLPSCQIARSPWLWWCTARGVGLSSRCCSATRARLERWKAQTGRAQSFPSWQFWIAREQASMETHDGVLLFQFFIRSNRAIGRPENVEPWPRTQGTEWNDIITYLGSGWFSDDGPRTRSSRKTCKTTTDGCVPDTKRRVETTIRRWYSVRVPYGVNPSPTKTDGTGL